MRLACGRHWRGCRPPLEASGLPREAAHYRPTPSIGVLTRAEAGSDATTVKTPGGGTRQPSIQEQQAQPSRYLPPASEDREHVSRMGPWLVSSRLNGAALDSDAAHRPAGLARLLRRPIRLAAGLHDSLEPPAPSPPRGPFSPRPPKLRLTRRAWPRSDAGMRSNTATPPNGS
jgi:hypothetical protein